MTIFGSVIFCILIVLFMLLGIFLVEKASDGLPWWSHLFLLPFYGIISVLLSLSIMILISYHDFVPDKQFSEKVEIYSIGTNIWGEVHGHFVLGCGTVSGATYPTYRFYTLTKDNKYHLNEVIAENFDIVCTDTVEPCIVYDETRMVMQPKMKILVDECIYYDIEDDNLKGTIYIPKNSIVQSYRIQL